MKIRKAVQGIALVIAVPAIAIIVYVAWIEIRLNNIGVAMPIHSGQVRLILSV